MIKVAFIVAKLKTGGAERQWYELIKGMDRKRFDITVICLYELGELGERIRDLGVQCHSNILKSRFALFSAHRLKKLLLHHKIDMVFIWNQPLTMLYAIPAAKMAGIQNIIGAIHNTGYVERKHRYNIFNKVCMRFLKKVVVLGTNHKNYAVQKEYVAPEKAVIIYNGVEIKNYETVIDRSKKKRELGIPPEAKVVGIIARLYTAKRHDIFLRAARRVSDKEKNVFFIIVGEGEEKDSIEALIRELGLGGNVKMLGLRKDIAELNHVMDVAVLCSDPVVETLPMTIIEAMASSIPVVATDVGSLSDLVLEGENGFLVAPGDVEALAEAVLKLLRDDSLAARMGRRGHEIACEKFSRDVMVKGYESLFEAEADS